VVSSSNFQQSTTISSSCRAAFGKLQEKGRSFSSWLISARFLSWTLTDNPDYEDEDGLDDLLELTFLYGQSIGRTLGTAIDFTVGPLRVEDLDEIKAVNDFRKSIVCSCFIFLILMLSPFSRFLKGRPIDPHRTVAPATLEVSPVYWTRRLRQVSPSLHCAV
jgi:hypothetical protein